MQTYSTSPSSPQVLLKSEMIVCQKSTESAWWIPVSHFIWVCSFSMMNPASFEAPLKYNNALYAEKLSKRIPFWNSASGIGLMFSSRLTLLRTMYLFSVITCCEGEIGIAKASFGHRALTFVCCQWGAVHLLQSITANTWLILLL